MGSCLKIGVTLVSLFFAAYSGLAQNLVPNSGFENITDSAGLTKSSTSYFSCIEGWRRVSGLPDYWNFRFKEKTTRNPTPKAGDACMGMHVTFARPNSMPSFESFGIQLTKPLVKGQRYYAEMYVTQDLKHYPKPIDNLGMYFSSIPFNELIGNSKGMERLKKIAAMQPQVISPAGEPLKNRGDWMLISGEFEATGGEKFLTIGRFRFEMSDLSATVYYYFDDIVVVPVEEKNTIETTDFAKMLESKEPLRLENVFSKRGRPPFKNNHFPN